MSKVLLIPYDNDSYIHWFPLGLAYIASALRWAGHDVSIYPKDQYHYPSSHLTDFLNREKFDVIGLGIVAGYWQYQEMLRIAKAINESKQRPFFVLGGHGPSPEPEYFLKKTGADAVVIGEGEETIVDLLRELQEKHPALGNVNGIAFKNQGLITEEVYINKRRPLIKDIDKIPLPCWELFDTDYYALLREPNICNAGRCMPMITARGCPFKCNFCYRMDEGIRLRSVESVVSEIQFLKTFHRINYISFMDELFMSSEERAMELSEAFMPLKIKWSCMGRLNFAKPKVLKAMKAAGCVFINYGIECMDDEVLRNMNKNLTVKQITAGIEATLESGISPGFNIIFGNVGENEKTLKKGVRFLLEYDDQAQLRTIRPVTPYPGSPLYYKAIKEGKLTGPADFYENKHKNSDLPCVNFTTLSDERVKEALYDANTTLLWNYHEKTRKRQMESFRKLYFEDDYSFRGLRQT